MEPQVVLVVDPDDEDRAEAVSMLGSALPDATVEAADSLAGAQAEFEDTHVDAVVTRYRLGDGTGLELSEWVRDHSPDTGCLLYAATEDIETADFEETVVEYVPRDIPDTGDQLVALLEAAVDDVTQAAYPLPEDEAGRLEAVERYTTGTERVDAPLGRIARLAADHFGVDVASINVIEDHEQTFLTRHGAGWPPTARDDSICTYTILQDRVMAVEDVREDPRFADNETIQNSAIRAYLGANLTTPAGYNIGSVCVYDDEPRVFSQADEDYLATLAALAMDVLSLGGDR